MAPTPYYQMPLWQVELHADFDAEFRAPDSEVQDELLAHIALLEHFGPRLGRPRVDTLKGSRRPSMKELRFDAAGGVWRFAFALDPTRQAVILCGGNKSGGNEARFYRTLIKRADARFDAHVTGFKRPMGDIRQNPKGRTR